MSLRDQGGHSQTFRCSCGETTENYVKNTKNPQNRILTGILKTLKFLQKHKDVVLVKRYKMTLKIRKIGQNRILDGVLKTLKFFKSKRNILMFSNVSYSYNTQYIYVTGCQIL